MALWTRPNVEDNDDDEFFGQDGESDDDGGCPADDLLGDEQQRQQCRSSLGLVHRADGSSQMRDHHGPTAKKKGLAGHEAAAIESHYQTLGYHETFESSQEATLQEGFVAGYTDNFDTAFQIGAWLGRAAAAHRIYHDMAQEKECLPDTDPENNNDDDIVFRKAVARIKTVLTDTATQKSASGIVVPPKIEEGDNVHDDDDDTCEISAKPRTDPLKELQLELEALVLPFQLPER